MFIYPLQATTVKTIPQFTYDLYNCIGINMLKYNNDSSAVIRILDTLVRTSRSVIEDLYYQVPLKFSSLDFVNVDRLASYMIRSVPNAIEDESSTGIYSNYLYGYSKYTGDKYVLFNVKDSSEFTRHSLPVDTFFGRKHSAIDNSYPVTLAPNVSHSLNKVIPSTKVTIRAIDGFGMYSREYEEPISIVITGQDMFSDDVSETVSIVDSCDIYSKYDYSYIESLRTVNATISVDIQVFPYLTGQNQVMSDMYTDREDNADYRMVVSVDMQNSDLVFSTIRETKAEYPNPSDPIKKVKINIADGESIVDYYADCANKMLYVVTSINKLYCFPLIIPIKTTNQIDDLKTAYQSVKIEYFEDSINERYTFYVYPTERTNGIESLNISINGTPYLENIMLDLIVSNLETNKFDIPFSSIFTSSEDAMVMFETYGDNKSVTPIYLHNVSLKPLYVKALSDLTSSYPAEPSSGMWTKPVVLSTSTGYVSDVSNASMNKICSLSTIGNVILGRHELVNVFDTFYYDSLSETIVTSDTITHILASDETGIESCSNKNNINLY